MYWLAFSIEQSFSPLIPPQFYFPGLGIAAVLLGLAFVGILVNAYIIKILLSYSNRLFEKLPFIKTLFGAIKDAVDLFQVKKEEAGKKAVSVEISPGVILIGFVTNDKVAKVLFPNEEKVAVYLPLSYQIGGYTTYVNPDKIKDLDMDVETAMRIAVTGGNSISSTYKKPNK